MIIHVIQRGETLWQVANRYGVSISQIVTANELPNADRLVIGQALVIPVAARQHTVRTGETLWQIAQRYGIPIRSILQANQISDPSVLYPGMVLFIPARTHTIQPGESLRQIALRYGTTVQEIIRTNQIQNPNLIYPGIVLTIPFTKRVIDVNAFTINMGEEGGRNVRDVGKHLTFTSTFAYIMRADGGLDPIDDTPIIQASIAEQAVPMMCITNFTFRDPGSRLAHTILSSTELQNRLLTNVVNTMKNKGYRGLNIDFENVYPADRELYNQFLQRAVDRLHQERYFVSTSLAPKTSSEQKGLLYEAHDYAAHGRIADFVILMTYEWGYRLGPPQSISPLNQIRRVLDYAVTVIPRNKIFMGFQLYARDWLLPHVQGQEAETFDMQEAIRRAIKYGAVIHYDQTSQTPFYRYEDEQGRTHEVWFEDARSAQAKFDTVKDYGLRGISYWVLGYPFPQNWILLEDNFRVRKLS
ncbi:LysM peptidoglycan-binding domain-containing protein [Bacillus methanolicus]|uniref:Glycoside hydrolase family 18 n=1 Tax=Bacillus methanolicus (strain MGA3 / ATCC 53907) TaxID=796606 RepID=I3E327_BACMM|nr:LysM peptidoglycan-binding domain-containing protein [Bacillus methanolicus]AIE59005.1 glycoside hydrolase family 18 [Bacillus methanolicus MGA3]EIJ80898.1 spore peptidoglycan hydrolase [Bacillus methanolicus MGA3]UQD51093.1 LysM peptidoglycan-binding domain-containing protein [Bacillus methanolicus]